MTRIRAAFSYANVMATVAVFLALGGGAYALSGVPDRNGVFHGCVNSRTGSLRIVKAASACHKARTITRGGRRVRIPGEQAIAWNQQGRPGVNGVNGVNGTNGTNGTNGATNLAVRTSTDNFASAGDGDNTVNCNPGERAVGGGVARSGGGSTGGDVVTASYPTVQVSGGGTAPAPAGSTPTGWNSGFHVASAAFVNYYAVCASP